MTARRFLVLHGVGNRRPRNHWQWWLTEELRSRGEQVLFPQLPRPDSPALDEWLEVLHGELAQLGDGERIVIAHSCSVALWLLAAPEISPEERVDRVLLVAPPGPSAFIAPYRAFLPLGLDREAITHASRTPAVVISSDNDPYCPEGPEAYASIYTAALGHNHQVIPAAGHLSTTDGYGPWPAMLRWCLTGEQQWHSDAPTSS